MHLPLILYISHRVIDSEVKRQNQKKANVSSKRFRFITVLPRPAPPPWDTSELAELLFTTLLPRALCSNPHFPIYIWGFKLANVAWLDLGAPNSRLRC